MWITRTFRKNKASAQWWQVVQSTLDSPPIVAMMLNVNCAILGHRDIFSVEIDIQNQVSELKNRIKDTELLSCKASSLELYWVQYHVPDEDEAYETLVESIHQNTIQFDPKNKLARPLQMLSSITGGFPKGNIHILVKVPEGESFISKA